MIHIDIIIDSCIIICISSCIHIDSYAYHIIIMMIIIHIISNHNAFNLHSILNQFIFKSIQINMMHHSYCIISYRGINI